MYLIVAVKQIDASFIKISVVKLLMKFFLLFKYQFQFFFIEFPFNCSYQFSLDF